MPPKAQVSYPNSDATGTRWLRPSPLPSPVLVFSDRDRESPRPSARRHWRCTSIAAGPTSASSKPKRSSGKAGLPARSGYKTHDDVEAPHATKQPDQQISKNRSSSVEKHIPLSLSGKSLNYSCVSPVASGVAHVTNGRRDAVARRLRVTSAVRRERRSRVVLPPCNKINAMRWLTRHPAASEHNRVTVTATSRGTLNLLHRDTVPRFRGELRTYTIAATSLER